MVLVFFMRVRVMSVFSMIFVRVGRLAGGLLGGNHVHLSSGQSAAAYLSHLQPSAYTERRSCFLKTSERYACIHQGAQQHIAAYAGKTLQISNTHG